MIFNFQELGRKFGRRAYYRFYIPGAAVAWKPLNQAYFSDRKFPLSDISRGGIAFLKNEPPSVESEISLLILLPPRKSETLELLGIVKYSIPRGPRLTYKYRIGVEFRQFEASESSNSLQSLTQIKAFERKYGNRKKRQ
jgi:hypothetical protein